MIMDKETGLKYHEEVNKIIRERGKYIENNYPRIRDATQKRYGLLALDPVRIEICICLIFGCHQASITLTNHLMESLLKYALITFGAKDDQESENPVRGRAISHIEEKYKELSEKFGIANLGNNINSACKKGLISKDQKKDLHTFRDKFRNSFSHSDKEKTFGDATMSIASARIGGDGNIEMGEKNDTKVTGFIIGQGIVQAELAKIEAIPYFLYIDSLVREIMKKIFPDITP